MAEWVAIKVVGHLDDARSAWFDGLLVERLAGGQTLLTGEIADQAALHGILARVRDLGLPLRAVTVTQTPTGTVSQD